MSNNLTVHFDQANWGTTRDEKTFCGQKISREIYGVEDKLQVSWHIDSPAFLSTFYEFNYPVVIKAAENYYRYRGKICNFCDKCMHHEIVQFRLLTLNGLKNT